jgi:cell division GTPase FtsZ
MKTIKLAITALLISVSFISCNDDKKKFLEKDIILFSKYVDSVSSVSNEKLAGNWESIAKMYSEKKLQAQSSAEAIRDNIELIERVSTIISKFDKFKTRFHEENERKLAIQEKTNF